jgi:hypothetical protein
MMNTIDLTEREGITDCLFGRPNHRIDIKTERALRLAQFKGALVANIVEMRRAIEEVRALNRARHEQYLDNFIFQRQTLEEQARLIYAQAAAARREAVEEAQNSALIAKCRAEAELARRSALPPPPPPPPPPVLPPEDPRAKNKARLNGEIERLTRDEAVEIQKITKGKPETEWSEELREDVARIQNMYHDARDKRRDELRSFL